MSAAHPPGLPEGRVKRARLAFPAALPVASTAAALCLSAAPAFAQWDGGWAVPSFETSTEITNSVLANEVALEAVRGEQGGRTAAARGQSPAGALTAPSPATSLQSRPSLAFRSDPAVSRRVQTQLVSGIRTTSSQDAVQEVEQALRSGRMRRAYEEGLSPLGIRPNDALDALAAYLMVTWAAANGNSNLEATPEMVRAVRGQVARAYSTTADLLDTNAERQEVGESLMYQVVILENLLQAMKAMPAGERQQVANQIHAASQKLLGYDLRDIVLTRQGFRRAG